MKFCSKCGQELVDEAAVCTNCGCFVSQSSQEKIDASNTSDQTPSTEKKFTTLYVFNFVFAITAALSVFFLILSLADAFIIAPIRYYSDGSYTLKMLEGWDYKPNGNVYSLFFAAISWVFSIVSFILALVKRAKVEKLLPTIAQVFISLLLIVLSIFTIL